MKNKTVFIEVNEVPFIIWDRFADRYPDSAIAQLMKSSSQYTTVTPDKGFVGHGSPHGRLTPWTTWPTVHRGVDNSEHGIFDIGQDLAEINKRFPPFWTYLSEAGNKVGVFGSVHSWPVPGDRYAFYVPDPFAADDEVVPEKLRPFQAFNLGTTRTSGQTSGSRIDRKTAAKFIATAPQLGVHAGTVLKFAHQLIDERRNPARATRRRALRSLIGFDVYEKLLEQMQPDASTFFVNHIAAAMHNYWAAAYPDDYEDYPEDRDWINQHDGVIDSAMKTVDEILGRLLRGVCADPAVALVVASSMGQAPTTPEVLRTELRVEDPERFMEFLGVPAGAWRRTTAPHFNIFVDSHYEDEFKRRSESLRINGQPVDRREAASGFYSLEFGQSDAGGLTVEIDHRLVDASELGLNNKAIQGKKLMCADHVPEGSLIVHNPRSTSPQQSRARIPSTSIAPAILVRHGVEPPAHMRAEPLEI